MSQETIDPRRRRCLRLPDWPEMDRMAWEAALAAAARPSLTGRSAAAGLAPASLKKTAEGYGRWLGFLSHHGMLEPTEAPAARVTPERAVAYFDELRTLGNADHTIVGRFDELWRALRIVAPGQDFTWLRKPGGVALRRRLPMERRALAVHHTRELMAWGMEMMEQAVGLAGPARRSVMLRDGLLIALLACRGMRLRSLASMRLGRHLHRAGDVWWVVLEAGDIKTRKPVSYPLPASLAPWIERYLSLERAELLGGRAGDAVWINWGGTALGLRGLEKRIRWWSAKRFGKEGVFGPHRFRHCIGTTGPAEDPTAPGVSAAVLGITAGVHRLHYDRGRRAAAAGRFHAGLSRMRRESASLAERLFAEAGNRDSEAAAAPIDHGGRHPAGRKG